MIRSMLLNGRATLAKTDAMGLSVLLVFTVIVRKSILQHILLNNEHCVLYHHATKVAYTACKRVRKVLSGTLDKVNIEMGHKRNLLFLSSLKPKETVRHYRKGQTKAKVVTGNYRTFTESVLVKDVERMNKHWIPMYNLYQPCAVSNDFIGSYEYLGSDANYVLRLRADNAYWRNWLGTLNQFPNLQSKMRVVLRVEVEAVKFLKEEPQRLDTLLKRCNSMTDTLSTLRRKVTEGLWKGQDDISGHSAKRADTGMTSDLNILTSPPLSLANWMPLSACDPNGLGPEQDSHPTSSYRSRVLDELPSRRGSDKTVSAEVRLAAERDWEEKRASLTQFSAQDINRLLEETQAELMKAIPDLDFAARQISKPAVPPKPHPKPQFTAPSVTSTSISATTTTTSSTSSEQQPTKIQATTQKLEGGSRRGSAELTVARYRTEKPSKSPPPPPPRRSFPSAHGLTTNSSGEVIVTAKKKPEAEDGEAPKTLVKLRRTTSDNPRPASTPPVIAASAIKDEDDEEKIISELEIFQRPPVKVSPPQSLPSNPSRHTSAACTLPCSLGRKNASSSPGASKGPQSTVAARLKQIQQGSLERPKNRKQREDFPKIPGQQQPKLSHIKDPVATLRVRERDSAALSPASTCPEPVHLILL
ncbi:hypothetical protein DPEC_G00329320 [Dallia pectoralis]|uniref:Uncharacterized protein n=1 Tax=Dallia pectoralis TaxID=75939 RepID=A0ACC2F8V4_DALPE|nr:hypothetical protein DPEC_G00329320 [Dallia pectoralis]